MSDTAKLAPSRPPPPVPRGPLAWMARNLFQSATSALTTAVLALVLGYGAVELLRWAVIDAVWSVPSATVEGTASCRLQAAGACWAVVAEKYRFILFGLYPFAEQWRSSLASAILILLFIASTQRRLWVGPIVLVWAVALTAVYLFMTGGLFGLRVVSEDRWGGLTVTLLLASTGMALSFPVAVLVALGRLSDKPSLRFVCYLYVELIRGVPLISVLFMASVLLPLLLPEGITISKLLRAQIAIVLFVAAYLSEIVRAGLQSLNPGQAEAATALGLGYWRTTLLIRLPQALRMALPAIVNLLIGFFKSTSLVMTIGIFDLLNAAKSAVAEPAWQGFGTETYLFAAAIYFAVCLSMSRYGLLLERSFRRGRADERYRRQRKWRLGRRRTSFTLTFKKMQQLTATIPLLRRPPGPAERLADPECTRPRRAHIEHRRSLWTGASDHSAAEGISGMRLREPCDATEQGTQKT